MIQYKWVVFFSMAALFSGSLYAEEAAVPVVETPAPVSALSAEIRIGTGIDNSNIAGEADEFPSTTPTLTGWSRVSGAQEPTTVSHIWILDGKEIARVDLNVKSASFRTWSRVTLAGRSGNGILQVVDNAGNTVESKTFRVVP